MIEVIVDEKIIKELEANLGQSKKMPNALKKAINETAKQAQRDAADAVRIKYAVKISGFSKAMPVKSATISRLEAVISSTGEANPLSRFKVRKNNAESSAYAKVLNSSSLGDLTLKNSSDAGTDLKAFVQKLPNGHIGVFRRLTSSERKNQQTYFDERGKKKTSRKNAMRQLYTVSIPQMLGNEKSIYGIVEPNIQMNLQTNINRHMEEMMKG
ncbi:hypothetical protein [Lachnotalea glycerini]|uniref:Prophage minor tail protein Z (GPZ) n=1 Tax=Lachnotalea glycerini TaxID=1763509 RepID=A0A371JC08_9FIRM|nr:hypothetical protein [Lachnotalea glycerini]RDY30294.1 hypothetical protein CG710_015275 [Lachnotalea glycerini]